MVFQTFIVGTDNYKSSFVPRTVSDWKVLPESVISLAGIADDCVAKFTSLVRARY